MISALALVAAARANYVAVPQQSYSAAYPVHSPPTAEAPKPTYQAASSVSVPASSSVSVSASPASSSVPVPIQPASSSAPMPTYPASVSSSKVPVYTTSTVVETKEFTITSCAPTVTNCPVGQKTSSVITKTTVCPVEETATSPPMGQATHPASAPMPTVPGSSKVPVYTTSAVYETQEYTITSCAPTVTNCPVGQKTSTVIAKTTVCPVEETATYPPQGQATNPPMGQATPPAGQPSYSTNINQGPACPGCNPGASAPYPTGPAMTVVTKPYSSAPPVGNYGAKNSTVPYVTSGAASVKAGGLLMAVGIVAALL